MADMHTPLLPCPHCGESEQLYPAYRLDKDGKCIVPPYAIDCLGCGTDFTPRDGTDAIATWNRRAPSQDAETIKALEQEAARQKQRGDNHWETLRSIRQMAKDGDCERIIQWVNDAGTGYVESAETTLAKAMDRAASVEKVLIVARTVIQEDRDAMFDSVTVAGIASTMDEFDRPHVDRLDAILSIIDAALAGSAS